MTPWSAGPHHTAAPPVTTPSDLVEAETSGRRSCGRVDSGGSAGTILGIIRTCDDERAID